MEHTHPVLKSRKAMRLFFLLLVWLPFSSPGQVEICDNGIDDDNDNMIDLNDPDCHCEVIIPESLIPNPSFEEMHCCPFTRSQLDCATNWIQASEATTDFIHQCGWLGWTEFPPPFPFPDGEGIMGFRDGRVRGDGSPEPFWKEYAGACLLSPLQAQSSYRFQFDVGFVDPLRSPPIDISFFGTTSCTYLPFGLGNEAFGCPTNSPDWVKLGEVRISGGPGGVWVNTFIEITPEEDIYAIAIGPACRAVPTQVSLYYFFDNLLLADLELFEIQISEILHPCNRDFGLAVNNNPAFEYQWYLEGVALSGETNAELSQNYGEGVYQVRVFDGILCRLSAKYDYRIPTLRTPERVAICAGETFNFGELQLREGGFYTDTFQSEHNCDSIVALELEVIGVKHDTIDATILDGEVFNIGNYTFQDAGAHPLVFTSSQGCDSLVLLNLSTFNVFIPTAFSPNNDGINDIFLPYASSDKIEAVEMKIFDRWGKMLHEGTEWDGSDSQPGVYVYLMQITFTYGESKHFSGSLTLLK